MSYDPRYSSGFYIQIRAQHETWATPCYDIVARASDGAFIERPGDVKAESITELLHAGFTIRALWPGAKP